MCAFAVKFSFLLVISKRLWYIPVYYATTGQYRFTSVLEFGIFKVITIASAIVSRLLSLFRLLICELISGGVINL